MRTRNNPEKVGEIFRKNLGKSNTEKEKEQSERRKKRQKKSHHKENSRKTNQNTPKKKPTEQGSIITKHRITSKVGLYNKAKSSKTVLRDQKVEDNMKKCVPDHEEELKKDLSRVLDCSSFRIKPLIASSGYISTEMTASSDIPISVPRQFSGRGSLNSSPRSIATVRSSACGSAVSNCSQSSQGRLPFKTPLHEISESLIASLHPAETFHGRNYFMEVREQILKVFKQSCARVNAEIKQGQVSSEVHKRCLKRKAAENIPQASQGQTSEVFAQRHDGNQNYFSADNASTCTFDVMQPCEPDVMQPCEPETMQNPRNSRIHDRDNIEPTNPINNKKSDLTLNKLFDEKESFDNRNYSFTHMEQLRSRRGTIHHENSISNCTSGFDIIDFIDHSSTENNLTEKSTITYDNRILDVSPPKKPSLDTPTPPRFYRRKMY